MSELTTNTEARGVVPGHQPKTGHRRSRASHPKTVLPRIREEITAFDEETDPLAGLNFTPIDAPSAVSLSQQQPPDGDVDPRFGHLTQLYRCPDFIRQCEHFRITREICIGGQWSFDGREWTHQTKHYTTQRGIWRNYECELWRDYFGIVQSVRYIRGVPPSELKIGVDAFTPSRHSPDSSTAWVYTWCNSILTGETLQHSTVPEKFKRTAANLQMASTGSLSSDDPVLQDIIGTSLREIDASGYTVIDIFRSFVSNWERLYKSPLATHVCNLMSVAIALGFAPDSLSTHEIQGVRIFSTVNKMKFDSAFSMADAVIMGLSYFVEACLASWETGSIAPFLFERTCSRQLDVAYEDIAKAVHALRMGQFYSEGGDWYVLFGYAEKVRKDYEAAYNLSTGLSQRVYQTRLVQIRAWILELSAEHKAGEIVKQPNCIVLYGAPKCGKSGLSKGLCEILSRLHNDRYKPEMLANILTDEAFHSQVVQETKFLMYNDVANRPLDLDKSNSIASMLQAADNIRFVPNKAAVEDKGKIMPDLYGIIGTTNNREMHMKRLSVCPESLMRRITLVDVTVRKEYRNEAGGLDSAKFAQNPKRIQIGGKFHNDFQTFTINVACGREYLPVRRNFDGKVKVAKNVNLLEFYQWMEHICGEHIREQEDHVTRMNEEFFDDCPTCNRVICGCAAGARFPVGNSQPVPESEYPEEEKKPPESKSFWRPWRTQDKKPVSVRGSHDDTAYRRFREQQYLKSRMAEEYGPGYRDDAPVEVEEHAESSDGEDLPSLESQSASNEEESDSESSREPPPPRQPSPRQRWIATRDSSGSVKSVRFTSETKQSGILGWVQKKTAAFAWKFITDRVVSDGEGDDAFKHNYKKLFEEWNYSDRLQWWYWIPDSWWKHCKPFCPLLLDSQINRTLRRCKRLEYWLRFGIATTITPAIVYCIASKIERIQQPETLQNLIIPPPSRVDRLVLPLVRPGLRAAGCMSIASFLNTAFMKINLDFAYQRLSMKRNAISIISKEERDSYSPYISTALTAISCMGGGLFLWDTFFRDKDEVKSVGEKPEKLLDERKQSRLSDYLAVSKSEDPPKAPDRPSNFLGESETDLQTKDAKIDAWRLNALSDMRTRSFHNPNMTVDQLCAKVKTNLSVVHYWREGKWKYMGNLLWICSDFALCPRHFLHDTECEWLVSDSSVPNNGKRITVTPAMCRRSHNSDVMLVHFKYRSKASLIEYINTDVEQIRAIFMRKTEGHDITSTPVPLQGFITQNNNGGKVLQWHHTTERTRDGFCGGVYVSENSGHPCIVGVHYAGLTGALENGRSCILSKDQVWAAIEQFSGKRTFLPTHYPISPATHVGTVKIYEPDDDRGVLVDQVSWVQNNSPSDFPKRAETRATPNEEKQAGGTEEEVNQGCVREGTRQARAFYTSKVVKTLISDRVLEKYPLLFGPPKFGYGMWPKSAAFAFDGSPGLPSEHLEWAVEDYMARFDTVPEYLRRSLKPLTWDETLNGIDGLRFIDSMNWSTSMGLGFPGGKKAYVTEYTTDDGKLRKEFVPEVRREFERVLSTVESGQRPGWIFSATPKDEPTPVEKDKVRLFQVGQISCVLLVRMYFTPVLRVLQMMSQSSECAVGINALSPDWECIMSHLDKFTNIFDGDFSKYDLRMSQDILSCAYRIMIEIAACGQYTVKDLTLMGIMASELISPLINYNGEVFRVDGSNPSGIPLTVIVNGLCNSLYSRCCYHSLYPADKPGSFRRYVSHINYGDDFINSVSWWRNGFNFLSLQEYLRKYGVKITPAHKDSEGKRFVDRESILFLQRQSVLLPQLGYRIGALTEKSRVKRLLSITQSKHVSVANVTADNIDSFLMETAPWGKEEYDRSQEWIQQIAFEENISHLCRFSNFSWSKMMTRLFDAEFEEQPSAKA